VVVVLETSLSQVIMVKDESAVRFKSIRDVKGSFKLKGNKFPTGSD
jgi:hypothetical protein